MSYTFRLSTVIKLYKKTSTVNAEKGAVRCAAIHKRTLLIHQLMSKDKWTFGEH